MYYNSFNPGEQVGNLRYFTQYLHYIANFTAQCEFQSL